MQFDTQVDSCHTFDVKSKFLFFGQQYLNAGLSMGNTLVLIPIFDPAGVLSAMQAEKVSVFAGVPTMYWALFNYEDKKNEFDISEAAFGGK